MDPIYQLRIHPVPRYPPPRHGLAQLGPIRVRRCRWLSHSVSDPAQPSLYLSNLAAASMPSVQLLPPTTHTASPRHKPTSMTSTLSATRQLTSSRPRQSTIQLSSSSKSTAPRALNHPKPHPAPRRLSPAANPVATAAPAPRNKCPHAQAYLPRRPPTSLAPPSPLPRSLHHPRPSGTRHSSNL